MKIPVTKGKRISVTYWNEVKLLDEFVGIFGVVKVENNRVFVLQEWR